jgi:hypothetical protein
MTENGFFYFEDGTIEANVQGRAGAKRLTASESSGTIADCSHSLINWTTQDPQTGETRDSLSGKYTKRVPGHIIASDVSQVYGRLDFFRSSRGRWVLQQMSWAVPTLADHAVNLINNARGSPGFETQRTGAVQHTTSSEAMTMVMQLGEVVNS